MKTKSVLVQIVLFVWVITMFSQTSTAQSVLYKKARNVGFSGNVIQSVDGGYAFAGNTRLGSSDEYELFVIKFNSAGKIQWKKKIKAPQIRFTPPIIVQLDDGTFLIGAGKLGVTLVDILLIRLDQTGKLIWSKLIDSGQYEYIRSIAKTSNGGFVLAGARFSDALGVEGALVIQVDSQGIVEWSRLYPDTKDEAAGIVESPKGGYFLSSILFDEVNLVPQMNLKKLNATGNILWNKNIKGAQATFPGEVAVTSKGSVLLAGTIIENQSDGILMHFSSSGGLLWKRQYAFDGLGGHLSVVDVSADGTFIVAGCATATNQCEASWIAKLSKTGKLIWKKVLDASFSSEDAFARATTDGGAIVTERTIDQSRSNGEIFLLKLDILGSSPACIAEFDHGLSVSNFSVKISNGTKGSNNLPVSVSDVAVTISKFAKGFPNGCN